MSPLAPRATPSAVSPQVEQLDLFALLAPRVRALAPPVRTEPLLRPSAAAPSWPFADTSPLAVEIADAAVPSGALTASVFDAYRPSVRVPGSQPHPTTLVESAAMAAATAPECGYRPVLPRHLVAGGHLSDAQLETIVRAGSAHSEHLPGTGDEAGPRQGYFVGDATGVGKA